MVNADSFFVIHKDCFLIQGRAQSLICDTGKSRIRAIPNSLYEILIEADRNDLNYGTILSSNIHTKGLYLFCNQLVHEGYAFFSPIPVLNPPKFNLEYLPWYLVVEIDHPSNNFLTTTVALIKELSPVFLQLRFPRFDGNGRLMEILKIFDQTILERLEIIIPYSQDSHRPGSSDELFNQIEQLEIINFYNYRDGDEQYTTTNGNIGYLLCEFDSLDSISVSMDTMICNYHSVNIANERNLGLFQKLKLKKDGYLENIGFRTKPYPLSLTTTKQDILNSEVAALWTVSKNSIDICSCCQYRLICHDTSEIIQQNNKNFRKHECSFDPYKNVWNS